MEKYNTIEIYFNNGPPIVAEADEGELDDYAYYGAAFIIKKSWEQRSASATCAMLSA